MHLAESTAKRELTFWSLALALHTMLFLWKGSPYLPNEEKWDPIVDVDIVQELAPREPPVNDRLGGSQASGEEAGGFVKQMKKFLGFTEAPKPVAPQKREELMMGDVNKKIAAPSAVQDTDNKQLVNKSGPAAKAFRVDNLSSPQAPAIQSGRTQAPVAGGGPAAPSTSGEEKLVNKNYRVAAGDLPFQVARAKEGDLLVGGPGGDTPVINVAKKSDRGVRTVSTDFVPNGTGGGGTGTGSGSGSGSGLAGASFSGTAIAPSRSSAELAGGGSGAGGGGGLIGAGRSGSGGGQGGTGRFFSGDGVGEGSGGGGSAAGGGNDIVGSGGLGGTGQGVGAGHGKGLFELTGPLSSRSILYHKIPPYPDWAAEKGILATVSLHFYVLSSGQVKEGIVVQRTSGYPALDNVAMDALKDWRFAPLPASQYGKEQWGIITFRFRAR